MPKQDIKIAKSRSGKSFEFVLTSNPPAGAMKYVYFSPKKDYVIGFFKEQPDSGKMQRLEDITGRIREGIFKQPDGAYWENLFSWPEDIVEFDGHTGIVIKTFPQCFYFQHDDKRKGHAKDSKWFSSAKLFNMLSENERGDF